MSSRPRPAARSQPRDRDQFARIALSGLPPLKDVRISSSEPMRIGGQPGHEVRAQGKDAQTGAEIEIVQWLRFGTGAYLRILGLRAEGTMGRQPSRASARCATDWSRGSLFRLLSELLPAGIVVGRRLPRPPARALAPPFDTATSAGRSTRSPIR